MDDIVTRIRHFAGQKIPSQLEGARESEKATENALVQPFLRDILGYNPDDSTEVKPQFPIQLGSGMKKCDFAIYHSGKPRILIECKSAKDPLQQTGQLSSYFNQVRDAQVGIYTNGLKYLIHTDIDHPNMMDHKPFLTVDLENIEESAANALSLIAKDSFNPEGIRKWATSHRTAQSIRDALRKELENPSDGLVKLLMRKAGITKGARIQQFRVPVTEAAAQLLSQPGTSTPIPDKDKGAGGEVIQPSPHEIPVRWVYRKQEHRATLLADGRVRLENGAEFATPSAACTPITRGGVNGWTSWKYQDESGKWLIINTLPRAAEMKEQNRHKKRES